MHQLFLARAELGIQDHFLDIGEGPTQTCSSPNDPGRCVGRKTESPSQGLRIHTVDVDETAVVEIGVSTRIADPQLKSDARVLQCDPFALISFAQIRLDCGNRYGRSTLRM